MSGAQQDLGYGQDTSAETIKVRIRNAHSYGMLRGQVEQVGKQVTAMAIVAKELGVDSRFLSPAAMVTIGEAAQHMERAARLLSQAALEVKPEPTSTPQ